MRYYFSLALAISLSECAGCNTAPAPEIAAIHGEVTLNKQPVESGIIQFVPIGEATGHLMGASIEDGKYQVNLEDSRSVSGTYAVRITAMRTTGETALNPSDPNGPSVALEKNYIPATYNSRTKLKVTVSDQGGEFDFHLVK